MNNDDLKRLLKQEINFDIKDCLEDIKSCDVDVLPCSCKQKFPYNKLIRYGVYGLLGISILGSSSYTAYNYVTPLTYVTIEIGGLKSNLSSNPIDENFMVKLEFNSYNKVINLEANKEFNYFTNFNHMDYKEAIPKIADYIKDLTDDKKSITFTVFSNDEERCFSIEDIIKKVECKTVHLNDKLFDQHSHLSLGKQRAISLILKHTCVYDRVSLEKKSLEELLNILFSL